MSVELVAIVGSATPPGRLRRAVAEALARAGTDGAVHTRLIDLGEQRIAPADGRPPESLEDDTADVLAAIAAADAVLLATPVYRGSLTGVLKNLLDHVPVEALQRKPVAIVAMGASDHHYLGAERHLRDVLAFFGALLCPVAVYLSSRDFEDGVPAATTGKELDDCLCELLSLAHARESISEAGGPLPLLARRR